MDKEKRMAGDYEIIHAIQVGNREIVVGLDPHGEYMCGYCSQNQLFRSYDEILLSEDYLEIMSIFTTRLDGQIQAVREARTMPPSQSDLITEEKCLPCDHTVELLHKIVAIKPDSLRYEYRQIDHQLLYVTGGFGAYGGSRGNTISSISLRTGQNAGRWERYDLLGEVQLEHIPAWALEAVRAYENSRDCPDKKQKEPER